MITMCDTDHLTQPRPPQAPPQSSLDNAWNALAAVTSYRIALGSLALGLGMRELMGGLLADLHHLSGLVALDWDDLIAMAHLHHAQETRASTR